eukprot:Em0003g260a
MLLGLFCLRQRRGDEALCNCPAPADTSEQSAIDKTGTEFPVTVLRHTSRNGESCIRDYLSWSEQLEALFCFPCRLFSTNDSLIKSSLASRRDSPEQRPLANDFEKADTRSFLSVRKRSPFQRRLMYRIGDKHNGLFIGVLEVIASYDSTLKGHLDKVRLSQEDNTRYLSPQSQNEFIKECSEKVLANIKLEISDAKYYAMILDSTPDASHKEQTTFILRYVSAVPRIADIVRVFEIQERFMDFSQKKGEDIALNALKQLNDWNIPFSDCRGQGYDNGSNMSGIHNGVQAVMRRDNEAALYSPCACHSLNLCGSNAAQCCSESLSDEDLTSAVTSFCAMYKNDVSKEMVEEMMLLKKIRHANLGDVQMSPLQLLNKLHDACLESLFPNVCISLRIFCTLPVTVASAERSFSQLKRIKSYSRSTMAQERLQGLALLCIESELAKTIDYDSIIATFASRKDRKAAL